MTENWISEGRGECFVALSIMLALISSFSVFPELYYYYG